MVLLGVCFVIPETDAHNPIGLRIRNENHFINEATLFFQDRNSLLIDRICEFFSFS
jgi:hypothetical protein